MKSLEDIEAMIGEVLGSGGLTLQPHQVLIRPLVTEKGMYQSESGNKYSFEVHFQATKTQIKEAVEKLFSVKVAKVSTQIRSGKTRRYRYKLGRTKDWKKALVTLKGDNKIDFF